MPDERRKTARGRALCVATDREAAEAGAALLKQGGNAFDAAVAAGFVEAVISPHNCGIGGYGATGVGFVARTGKLVAIDANAVAPRAATATMFPTLPTRDPNGYKLADDRHKVGPLSVAVPGVLGGLLLALETWGTRSRAAVMAPAIAHARRGVLLTAGHAKAWHAMKVAADGGDPTPPSRATHVRFDRLAETLEAIAVGGADVFYGGKLGRAIADHVRALGGILSRRDMADYRPLIVEPISITIRGRTLATPPPGSGGLTSLQVVALVDRLGRAEPGSVGALEAFLEVLKVAWEDRLTTLADPAAMPKPPATLIAGDHIDRLLARVREGLANPTPGRVVAPDPLKGTVHLAAADAEGNVFAWTQTHGGGFGAQVMVPGTEVVLGHGMCRFEPRPGWPNSVGPGKRPLHNMAPIVALRADRAVWTVGASGGRTIVNNVAALSLALLDGRDPEPALAAPRLQCETVEPAVLEQSAGADVIASLRRRHQVREVPRDAGNVYVLARVDDGWLGAAEPRNPKSGVGLAAV